MSSQRPMFVSGLFVGVVCGLSLASLFPARNVSPVELSMEEGPTAGPRLRDDFDLGPPGPLAPSSTDWNDDSSGRSTLDEPLAPSPLRNALALDTEAAPSSWQASSELEIPVNAPEEPQALQVEEATPLPGSNQQEELLRAIIESELPDLPEEQREIWYEALQDVRKEDMLGILRMWKMLGGPDKGRFGEDPPAPSIPPAAPKPTREAASRASAFRSAQRVHLENALHAYDPGYIRRLPTSVDAPGADKVNFDFTTRFIREGFLLDWVIQGPGFFIVLDPETQERRLTRNGRFTLDAERRIVLRCGERTWWLQPEIVIPASAPLVNVSPSGAITTGGQNVPADKIQQLSLAGLLSPQALEPMEPGMFRVKESMLFEAAPLQDGLGGILQGAYELPTIDPRGELELAKQWAELAEMLQE